MSFRVSWSKHIHEKHPTLNNKKRKKTLLRPNLCLNYEKRGLTLYELLGFAIDVYKRHAKVAKDTQDINVLRSHKWATTTKLAYIYKHKHIYAVTNYIYIYVYIYIYIYIYIYRERERERERMRYIILFWKMRYIILFFPLTNLLIG